MRCSHLNRALCVSCSHVRKNMDDKDLEILKLRYQDQVELLRFLTTLELKMIFGFFTVLGALCAWVLSKAPQQFDGKVHLCLIIAVSTICVIYYLYSQKRRRDEAVKTIVNLNTALGLYEVGRFIPDKAINPESGYKPLFKLYLVAIFFAAISAIVLIYNT